MDGRWLRRIAVPGALVLLLGLALNPVPASAPENCDAVSGRVVGVDFLDCRDVVLELEGDDRHFYVNRGQDRGIDRALFPDQVVGRRVTLQVIRRPWSPLDPTHSAAPVARVALGDDVLFSAFD